MRILTSTPRLAPRPTTDEDLVEAAAKTQDDELEEDDYLVPSVPDRIRAFEELIRKSGTVVDATQPRKDALFRLPRSRSCPGRASESDDVRQSGEKSTGHVSRSTERTLHESRRMSGSSSSGYTGSTTSPEPEHTQRSASLASFHRSASFGSVFSGRTVITPPRPDDEEDRRIESEIFTIDHLDSLDIEDSQLFSMNQSDDVDDHVLIDDEQENAWSECDEPERVRIQSSVSSEVSFFKNIFMMLRSVGRSVKFWRFDAAVFPCLEAAVLILSVCFETGVFPAGRDVSLRGPARREDRFGLRLVCCC